MKNFTLVGTTRGDQCREIDLAPDQGAMAVAHAGFARNVLTEDFLQGIIGLSGKALRGEQVLYDEENRSRQAMAELGQGSLALVGPTESHLGDTSGMGRVVYSLELPLDDENGLPPADLLEPGDSLVRVGGLLKIRYDDPTVLRIGDFCGSLLLYKSEDGSR